MTFKDLKYFKDPLTFDPERFNPDNEATKKMNPFSAGQRNCIGQKFAINSIKTSIAKVLKHYELVPIGEDPIITHELLSRSINGMQMGLTLRQYA